MTVLSIICNSRLNHVHLTEVGKSNNNNIVLAYTVIKKHDILRYNAIMTITAAVKCGISYMHIIAGTIICLYSI